MASWADLSTLFDGARESYRNCYYIFFSIPKKG